jgi:putative SOS response-associated peptidase YedK
LYLIPAYGFYEWRKTARPKLPFAIAMKDGRSFTFAGLWENWKDPESGDGLRTCTIITGEPNELVRADPSPDAGDSSSSNITQLG